MIKVDEYELKHTFCKDSGTVTVENQSTEY